MAPRAGRARASNGPTTAMCPVNVGGGVSRWLYCAKEAMRCMGSAAFYALRTSA